MAIYISMSIEDKTAVNIPDNIATSFKLTKSNKQLSFPMILISKNAVNIELTMPPIAMSMLERIAMRKQERSFLNCEDFE